MFSKVNRKNTVRTIIVILFIAVIGTVIVGFTSSTDSQAQEAPVPAPVGDYHLDATTSADGYFLVCPGAPQRECTQRHFAMWIRTDGTVSSVTVQLTNVASATAWKNATSNNVLIGQMNATFDAATQTVTVTLEEGQNSFLLYVTAANGTDPYGFNLPE